MSRRENLKSVLECDRCGCDQMKVVDSRQTMGIRWRMRECAECKNRVPSYEIRWEDFEFLMKSKNNQESVMKLVDKFNVLVEQMKED